MTGRVRVTRSGGGLGESRTATATRSVIRISGRSGNSEAMWPSGPTPRKQMSNDGHGVPSSWGNRASSAA